MKGYQFRRQRPVLRYIADFLCIEEYERCYRENRKGGGRNGDVQSLHFSTPCTPASGGHLPLHPHKQGTREVVKLSEKPQSPLLTTGISLTIFKYIYRDD